jgi:hypothetical protein
METVTDERTESCEEKCKLIEDDGDDLRILGRDLILMARVVLSTSKSATEVLRKQRR